MRELNFDEDFSKLDEKLFTTIRMPPKLYRPGELILMKSPSKEFTGIFIKGQTEEVSNIEDEFLIEDTGTETREEALEVLRRFYPDLKETDKVQILWFMRDNRAAA